MRKITKEAIKAFYNREPFKKSNTVIENKEGKTYLKLFGNVIATLDENNELFITTAGWNSVTTRERLNGLNEVNDLFITTAGWNSVTTRERLNGLSGVRLGTSKRQLYLNNVPWDGKLTNIKDYENI